MVWMTSGSGIKNYMPEKSLNRQHQLAPPIPDEARADWVKGGPYTT